MTVHTVLTHRPSRPRNVAVSLAVAGFGLLVPTAATATPNAGSSSVGVSATGKAELPYALTPGTRYRFVVQVANPGTLKSTYQVTVLSRDVPAEQWFRVAHPQLTLRPGKHRAVEVELAVPKDATAAHHEVRLQTSLAPQGGGAALAGGAVTRVIFDVAAKVAS